MTTAQGNLFAELPPPQAAGPCAAREIVTGAQAAHAAGRQHHQEPPPPDFAAFAVNPESRYAADEQEAEALAAICAAELKGYLFAARVLGIAVKAGRNPLYTNSQPFTEKQTKELTEATREAESFAVWMLSECADAFGEEDARRLHEYARACVDAAFPDRVPEATREAEQGALTF